MDSMLIAILVICTIISLLACSFYLIRKHTQAIARLESEQQQVEQQVSLFKQHLMQVEERLNEFQTANRGVGDNLKTVAKQVSELTLQHEKMENSEPQSRLYSKASKMAAQGASVEELIQDCELPRAEAELLVSLHNKQQ